MSFRKGDFYPSGITRLDYRIQRWSSDLDEDLTKRRAGLVLGVWEGKFAETGYEGNALRTKALTGAEEIRFVDMIRSLGGLAAKA